MYYVLTCDLPRDYGSEYSSPMNYMPIKGNAKNKPYYMEVEKTRKTLI